MKLLLIYEPNEGRILVDDYDISKVTQIVLGTDWYCSTRLLIIRGYDK